MTARTPPGKGVSKGGLRIPTHVTFEVFDGEAVVVDLETGYYFSLNETATVILQALKEGLSLGETVGLLVRDFAVDSETAEKDYQGLVEELASKGLLEPVP